MYEEPSASHAAAVEQLFDDNNRTLVRFLHARLQDEGEARDIAQEAYVRMLELDNPGAIGFLKAYLFRIAANLAVDRLRQRGIRETTGHEEMFAELSDERTPERICIASEDLETVKTVLAELPAKCRRAFVLHVFGNASTTEIAAQFGVSDRMIRLYITQALALCKARIAVGKHGAGGV
jgi:RNA polymerase sigma factor (sigma-70 family)